MSDHQQDLTNEYKKKIEEMFAMTNHHQYKETVRPRRRLRLPEAPSLTIQQKELAREFGKEELEIIQEAFKEFYDQVEDLALFKSYLYPHTEEFKSAVEDMALLVLDQINYSQLSERGRTEYEELRKIQGNIWHELYNKYRTD